MDAVVRGLFIYAFLTVLFAVAGKRAVAQMDTFDFILLLIVSEATQNAMIGQNHSITYAALLIVTLIGAEILMSIARQRFPRIELWLDGIPLIIIENGKPIETRMHKAKIDLSDVLTTAREKQGLERLDQIKYAILERGGSISIVPKEHS